MKYFFCFLASALLTTGALPVPASAQQSAVTESRLARSEEQSTPDAALEARQADAWGLQPEEWTRYRLLMRESPLGVHSPLLDPLTALGIEARSEEERRHYAELQVKYEVRRVERLLAYQRAYDAAWQRLHPDLPRVSLPDARPHANAEGTLRTALFIREACDACDRRAVQLQAEGQGFDIYVVSSRGDDTRIRAWARRVGLDAAQVRSGHITLNHDGGRWLSLSLPGALPAAVRQINGQWQRLP